MMKRILSLMYKEFQLNSMFRRLLLLDLLVLLVLVGLLENFQIQSMMSHNKYM
jgi:hypothetical protein